MRCPAATRLRLQLPLRPSIMRGGRYKAALASGVWGEHSAALTCSLVESCRRFSSSKLVARPAGSGSATEAVRREGAASKLRTAHTGKNQKEMNTVMSDSEIIAEATKLLLQLPPRNAKKGGEKVPVRSSSFVTPPDADANEKPALVPGMPSRTPHILSRAQKKEFKEAFSLAEEAVKEERVRATKLADQVAMNKNWRRQTKDGSADEKSVSIDLLNREGYASAAPVPTDSFGPSPSIANPFRGLHEHVRRSYRLDDVVSQARQEDIIIAKQEEKTGAFSFLTLQSRLETFQQHWEVRSALQAMQHTCVRGEKGSGVVGRDADGEDKTLVDPVERWGGMGWNQCLADVDYPVLLAQRLLLFPPSQRHFHIVCGRQDVPCDFFADVDLPDTSVEDGERILVQILDYLEVRLPGVGFTDPFFLILANEDPAEAVASSSTRRSKAIKKKISYHIHARSMSHVFSRNERSIDELVSVLKKTQRRHKRLDTKSSKKDNAEGGNEAVRPSDEASNLKVSRPSRNATKVIAFQDYRTVKLIADEVNQTLGFNAVDEGCYRVHGSLRCAFSSKTMSQKDRILGVAQESAVMPSLVPLQVTPGQDPQLQEKLRGMHDVLGTLSAPEILAMTFCTRHLHDGGASILQPLHKRLVSLATCGKSVPDDLFRATTPHAFKLVKPSAVVGNRSADHLADGTARGAPVEYDAYGNAVSPYLTEAAKWRRYKSVIRKLQHAPPRAATSFDIWVRIGLALHNFSNEEHVFEEWVKFSLKCPQKFSREACRKKWMQFERNPDALNWRRGFNYLNQTLWRQIG